MEDEWKRARKWASTSREWRRELAETPRPGRGNEHRKLETMHSRHARCGDGDTLRGPGVGEISGRVKTMRSELENWFRGLFPALRFLSLSDLVSPIYVGTYEDFQNTGLKVMTSESGKLGSSSVAPCFK